MITLYGIPNCDTVRKARAWLGERGISYLFHDYRKAGVDAAALDRWIAALGWERVLNCAGTTFRKLADVDKDDLDGSKARGLMLAHPSAIRRPVIEGDGMLLAGFDPDTYIAAGL